MEVGPAQDAPGMPPLSDFNDFSQTPLKRTRQLSFMVVAIVIAWGVAIGFFEHRLLLLLPGLCLYPWLLPWIEERWAGSPERQRSLEVVLDGWVMGLSMAAIQFSLTISLFFAIMLNAAVLHRAASQAWATSMVFVIIGALSGMTVFGLHPHLSAPWPLSLGAGLGTICFIGLNAYYTRKQYQAFLQARNQVVQQQQEAILLSRKLVKYLPPQVWESIFSGRRDVKLQTHRKKLTIFFSDIKDFTETTDEMSPDALTEMINHYFDQMSRIALKYGGTIDKFIGDAILIFFGDPKSLGTREDALACVSMAIDMRNMMKVLRHRWQAQGILKPLHVRMGLTTGFCHVGNFGSESRMDYTIIGREANLAARLQTAAQPDEILIAHETYLLVRERILCKEKGLITVKGINRPIQVWSVVDFRRDLGAQSSFIEHELDGFTMHLDLTKLKNYDKDRVVQALENAARNLRDRTIL